MIINFLTRQNFTIDINDNITIAELKNKIREQRNDVYKKYKRNFKLFSKLEQLNQLQDIKLLSDYKLSNSSILLLIPDNIDYNDKDINNFWNIK